MAGSGFVTLFYSQVLPRVTPTAGMIWSNVVAGAVITVLGLSGTCFAMRGRNLAAR